jgi:hypothetical protein
MVFGTYTLRKVIFLKTFMKNLRFALTTLVVLFSISACSAPKAPSAENAATPTTPSNEAPAPVAVPDACKYLTKEIAETVVGSVDTAPKTNGSGNGISNCMYLSTDLSAVSLLIQVGSSGSDFEKGFGLSKSISGVDPVKVDGLGDGAFWAGGTLNQMNILKGNNLMIVSGMGLKGDTQSVLKDVSLKILANM